MPPTTPNTTIIFFQQLIQAIDNLTAAVKASGVAGAGIPGLTGPAGQAQAGTAATPGASKQQVGASMGDIPIVGAALKLAALKSTAASEVSRAITDPLLDTYKAEQIKPYEATKNYVEDSIKAGVMPTRDEIKNYHEQVKKLGVMESDALAFARQEAGIAPGWYNDKAAGGMQWFLDVLGVSKSQAHRQSYINANNKLQGE